MINTNLPPILHRFGVIAFDMSEIAIFRYPSYTRRRGSPGTITVKFSVDVSGWPSEEKLPKILTGYVRCTNVTDDRQTTDGLAIAYSEREREFPFAKNRQARLEGT